MKQWFLILEVDDFRIRLSVEAPTIPERRDEYREIYFSLKGKRRRAVFWVVPDSNLNDPHTAMPAMEWNAQVMWKDNSGLPVRSVDDDSILAAMSYIFRNGMEASAFREGDSKTLCMIERFEEQIARNPRDADAFAQIGSWWTSQEDYGKAVQHLDTALHFDPNNTEALRVRAQLRSTCPDAEFRDGKGALRDICRAMNIAMSIGRLNGDWLHRRYLRIRAAAHAELSQYELAISFAMKALKLSITRRARDSVENELEKYIAREPLRGPRFAFCEQKQYSVIEGNLGLTVRQ